MKCIAFKSGYKYQLHEEYSVAIPLTPEETIVTEYITLTRDGVLTLKKGYAWDGPSGPTVDTPSFMRGSLIHDALYQLMRERKLDHDKHRTAADQILHDICREDGMSALWAWCVLLGVRKFGDPAADPANDHPVIHAPKAARRSGRGEVHMLKLCYQE